MVIFYCHEYIIYMVVIMTELDLCKLELKRKNDLCIELREEMDLADEINYNELRDAERHNNLLIGLIVALVFWVIYLF